MVSKRHKQPVILGYHGIGRVKIQDDPLRLYVDPAELVRHIRALQKRGYEFVSMGDFADRIGKAGKPLPGVAALTFDDGTVDHATVLPALLEELEVPGTVYVCPGLAGEPYPWTNDAHARFMSEIELVTLAAHPLVEIGSHTHMHRELHEDSYDTAIKELTGSKHTLEVLLDGDILSFCYPRCHYSEGAREAVRDAGFTNAVTCGARGSWDPYTLKREVFHTLDGPAVTAMKTRGAYSALGDTIAAKGIRVLARAYDRLIPRRS